MANPTVIFDPYATTDLRSVVQRMVDHYNVAATGGYYPSLAKSATLLLK
jgi:hypothetical protein